MCGGEGNATDVAYSHDDNIGAVLGLDSGTYLFRVTGSEDPYKQDVEWTFCGVEGGAQSQLTFTISSDCACEPVSLHTNCDDEGYSLSEAEMTLEVRLGLQFDADSSAVLMSGEKSVLSSTVREAFEGTLSRGELSERMLSVESTRLVKRDESASRKLDVALDRTLHEMFVVVRLRDEMYDVAAKRSELGALQADLKSFFEQSTSSGVLSARIRSLARERGVQSLQETSFTRLLSLEMRHITHINQEVSFLANGVVVASLIGGLIFVGLMFMSLDQYRRRAVVPYMHLAADSERGN